MATGAGLHDTTVGLGDRSQPSVVITYIAPTAVDASLSDLTLPADGTSQGTLTLTVDDTYGQGVPGDDIAFTAADPNVQFGSVADGQDGTYTVPVPASSTAGAVAITATDTSVNDVVAHGVSRPHQPAAGHRSVTRRAGRRDRRRRHLRPADVGG